MATARNDSKGYERGARGIDGTKGEGWHNDHRNKPAEAAMFGEGWWGVSGKSDITSPGSVNGQGGHSTDKLIRGANGTWKP